MKKKAPKKKAKAGVTVAHIPSIELTLSSPLVSIPAPTTNGAHPQAIQEEGSIPDDELYSPLDPTPVLPLLDPAALLLQTHNFLPSARFHELLQKHLVPLLESNHLLPEELKRTIAEALEEARATQEDENKYTQYIQYEEHKERIGELLVRGTDTALEKLAVECRSWIAKLHACAIQRGYHLAQVCDSVKLIDTAISKCITAETYVNFNQDLPVRPLFKIESTDKVTLYIQRNYRKLIIQLWRDLALRAISDGGKVNERLVRWIIAQVDAKGCTQQFAAFSRTAGQRAIPESAPEKPWMKIYYNDDWHSPAFIAAIPTLHETIVTIQVSNFAHSPTNQLYDYLLSLQASAKPELDSMVHRAMFPYDHDRNIGLDPYDAHAKEVYTLAARVFTEQKDLSGLDVICDRLCAQAEVWKLETLFNVLEALVGISPEAKGKAREMLDYQIDLFKQRFWKEINTVVVDYSKLCKALRLPGDADEVKGLLETTYARSGVHFEKDGLVVWIRGIEKVVRIWPDNGEKQQLLDSIRFSDRQPGSVLLTHNYLAELLADDLECFDGMSHLIRGIEDFFVGFGTASELSLARMKSRIASRGR